MPYGMGYTQPRGNDLASILYGGGGGAPTAYGGGRATAPPGEDPLELERHKRRGDKGRFGVPVRFKNPAQQPLKFALADLLAGRGATPPNLLNRNLADLSISNQNQQDAVRGMLAAGGQTGNMGGNALEAAVGQAGVEGRGRLLAEDTAAQHERYMQILQLLLGLRGQRKGVQAARAGRPPAAEGGGLDIGALASVAAAFI